MTMGETCAALLRDIRQVQVMLLANIALSGITLGLVAAGLWR